MQFKVLSGDINWATYGGKFVSKRLNNGDWDYWLVLEVVNMWDATGDETQPQYYVSLNSVSPQAAGKANLDSAFSCYGFSDDTDLSDPLLQVEALSDYGISAVLWQEQGNNIAKLMREAHRQASISTSFLFGFQMDAPKNRIGQSGWDMIAGQSPRDFFNSR